MIKLMMADDHIMVRKGLKALLELESDMSIEAEVKDSNECMDFLSKNVIDILILNLQMENSIDLLEKLKFGYEKKISILVLVQEKDFCDLVRAVDIGADGFLSIKSEFDELKQAIYCIMRDDIYFQKNLLTSYYKYHDTILKNLRRKETLTKREIEILKNLAVGMYNKEIAIKLGISERTVKNHVFSIFKKLGCTDRTQAAVFAISTQIVDLYK